MSVHGHGRNRDRSIPPRGRLRRGRYRVRSLAVPAAGLALVLAAVGAATGVTTGAAAAAPNPPRTAPRTAASAGPVSKAAAPRVAALPKLGIWTWVSQGMTTESPPPALWVSPNGTGWDVFPRQLGAGNFTYEVVKLGPFGSVASGPADIFAIHWGSLQFGPTLLGDGAVPVLVFDGIRGTTGPYSRGCVYGAAPGKTTWTLQPWTLSHDCVNPVAAAAENTPSARVLAAAWPGGWATGSGINYRIGVSAAIPAATDDRHILLTKATAFPTGMANDVNGSGHFYVAWAQVFSVPASRDGIYIQDVTAGSPARKAPDTGTFTVSDDMSPVAKLAITNRNFHSGVFLAYCANSAGPCHLLFWRVGAAKAVAVPSSANAFSVSIAQGPGGRIWVAWYNAASNRVFVTRTNIADTKFGAVESYATPCFEHGMLGLGGSPVPRLDIGMQCVDNAHLQAEQYTAQVLAGLTLGIPGPVKVGTSAVTIKITVTDAGDPVKGAIVKVDGKSAGTNAAGQATFTLPASIKAGSYKVTATAADYLLATGTLVVRK
jgi:hypothetical protein